MAVKSSSNKLEQQITDLENHVAAMEEARVKLCESEARFRATFDQAAVGIGHVGIDGEWLWVNRKLAEIVGCTPEGIRGMTLQDVTHPDDLPPVLDCLEQTLAGLSDTCSLDKRYIRRNGLSVWVHLTVTLVRQPSGQPDYFIAVVEDISERIKAREELQDSEAKYQTITDAAKTAIIMMDGSGRISFWNPAAVRIFGYSREEALGKDLHTLFAPKEHQAAYRQGFEKFKATGKGPAIGKTLELYAVRKDGTEFPIELSLSAIQVKGRWNAIGIVRDITERKQAEEALLRAHNELELRVAQRTAELVRANEQLAGEIEERKRATEALERRSRELEEVNTALKVLLQQSSEAKQVLEEKVLANIKELVFPHIEDLEIKLSDRREKLSLFVIKSNLAQITSSFSQTLSSKALNLTPREIQVADLVRQGRTNKEIAALLNVSTHTVEFYRANIRKKCGLRNQKVNLRSFLHSLPK